MLNDLTYLSEKVNIKISDKINLSQKDYILRKNLNI